MCGSHLHSTWPGCDLLALLDQQHGAVGHASSSSSDAFLGAQDEQLAVARQGHALALVVDDRGDALELDGAGLLGLDLAFLDGTRLTTPPMWKVRMVSCVPGSPIDWAAMMPTAMPSSTRLPVARSMP